MTKLQEKQNIPSGWQEKKLGDVCDIVNGSTPKRSVLEYWENGSIPWFTVDDIRSNGRIISKTNQSITDKALKETSVKLLPEDSVLKKGLTQDLLSGKVRTDHFANAGKMVR